MADAPVYFLEENIKRVARGMYEITSQYEQLFVDLGSRIFEDIAHHNDPSKTLKICIDHIDQAILAFRKHFPDNSTVACKKGCHFCCFFSIECPPQVLVDITRYLKATLSPEKQQKIRQKLSLDISRRQPPLQRAPCPFLDKSGTCSIYEKRPLACRSFSSPDATACEQSVTDGRNITQHPVHYRIYQVATAALLSSAKQQGRHHKQLAFIPSLQKALEAEDEDVIW